MSPQVLLRALASGDELGYSQRMARLNADDKPSFLKAHACCDAHHPSAEARLAEAEAVCARKGSRLTAQRRMVLEHRAGAGSLRPDFKDRGDSRAQARADHDLSRARFPC